MLEQKDRKKGNDKHSLHTLHLLGLRPRLPPYRGSCSVSTSACFVCHIVPRKQLILGLFGFSSSPHSLGHFAGEWEKERWTASAQLFSTSHPSPFWAAASQGCCWRFFFVSSSSFSFSSFSFPGFFASWPSDLRFSWFFILAACTRSAVWALWYSLKFKLLGLDRKNPKQFPGSTEWSVHCVFIAEYPPSTK